jgi:hypothetical protein
MAYIGFPLARLTFGEVNAKELYVPEGVGCGTPGDAYWQVSD